MKNVNIIFYNFTTHYELNIFYKSKFKINEEHQIYKNL